MEQIWQTDELIDATVYKLYGLKEEEIRIVEGNKAWAENFIKLVKLKYQNLYVSSFLLATKAMRISLRC